MIQIIVRIFVPTFNLSSCYSLYFLGNCSEPGFTASETPSDIRLQNIQRVGVERSRQIDSEAAISYVRTEVFILCGDTVARKVSCLLNVMKIYAIDRAHSIY